MVYDAVLHLLLLTYKQRRRLTEYQRNHRITEYISDFLPSCLFSYLDSVFIFSKRDDSFHEPVGIKNSEFLTDSA